MKTMVLMLLGVSVVWGASLRGEYVEARNADVYTGACFANSEVGLVGQYAVLGWRISKGTWEGVKLDGLSVVGVVRAAGTLGDRFHTAYPVKSVLIIDQRADSAQRLALKNFARRMSGDLLQDVVRIEYRPISLSFKDGNLHTATATLTAGELAAIRTRALDDDDQVCHHEEVWYEPLAEVDHAMPAYALANSFGGKGLDATWSSPEKRSAFVASFHYGD